MYTNKNIYRSWRSPFAPEVQATIADRFMAIISTAVPEPSHNASENNPLKLNVGSLPEGELI